MKSVVLLGQTKALGELQGMSRDGNDWTNLMSLGEKGCAYPLSRHKN